MPAAGIALDRIAFTGLRGKGLLAHADRRRAPAAAPSPPACASCAGARADAVLGMGGYVCFPGGLMASLLGKPLVLVNADASLLLSNKRAAAGGRRVAFGFDGDCGRRRPSKAVVTGNPVRAEIEALPAPARALRRPQRRRCALLVVGGSLGAQVLNDMPAAGAGAADAGAAAARRRTRPAQAARDDVRAAYAAAGVEAEVLPFIDDMAARLADCDVIVCRAGAITVSELCAAGVASVLVPFVVSTTSHQRDNAPGWRSTARRSTCRRPS